MLDKILGFNQGKKSVPLIQELPYGEFDEDNKIFILSDSSIGVIYRIELVEHEPLRVIELQEFRSQLEQWLNLPSNCVAQFLFEQRCLLPEEIEERLKLPFKAENATAEFLRSQRIEWLKERTKCEHDLFGRHGYFAIRFVPEANAFRVQDHLPESLFDSVVAGTKRHERKVEEFSKILSRIESLSKIKIVRIDASELRDVVQRMLYSSDRQPLATINKNIPLNEQMVFKPVEANEAGLIGKRVTRTVSFLVPSIHYEGVSSLFLKLKFPFSLSLRMTFPSKAKVGKILAIKEWCTKKSFSPRSQVQFEELQQTKRQIAEGDPCVHLCWSITVEGENEKEAMERANKVVAFAIESFDGNAIIETDVGFDLLRSSLPLHFDPKSEWGTQRHIPLHRSEIINFIPIFESYRGSKVPLQVYRSREGNLAPISAVEGATSKHLLLLGDSGSGKSAFLNSLINGFKALSPEPITIVIDFNTSQTMNVKFYGGELNRFNPSQTCPASIFRGLYDEKKFTVLTNWICEAIRLTSPSFKIESEHREAVSQAAKRAFRKRLLASGVKFVEGELLEFESNGETAIDMDVIAAELSYLPGQEGFEKFREPVENLLVKLRNFYGDGLYAQYFRSPKESLVYDKKFYVYDLVEIQDDPVLLNLTIASLFEEVRQVKLLPENQEREVWAIFDEIAVLSRGSDLLSQYIVTKAETGRKDAFWVAAATNRPQNFFEIPSCLALLQVAEYAGYLPMSKDNIALLAKHSSDVTEADCEIIDSLRMTRGVSNEIYMKKKSGGGGVVVYEQLPHERWQSPTNAKEGREALKALKKFNDNAVEAIQYLVETFPKGVV